jgi:hypothetical protein
VPTSRFTHERSYSIRVLSSPLRRGTSVTPDVSSRHDPLHPTNSCRPQSCVPCPCMTAPQCVRLIAPLLLVSSTGVAGCGGGSPSAGQITAPAISVATTPSATSVAPAALPDLTGKGLQYAQDAAQASGFRTLTSHDALGRGRHQILDRDWRVCSQLPPAGQLSTSTPIDFGAVKTDETCPATDNPRPSTGSAGAEVMPKVVGLSGAAAQAALGGNASVTLSDATGAGRVVVVPSNWRVCSQSPAPGTPYAGVPVALKVVKYRETC